MVALNSDILRTDLAGQPTPKAVRAVKTSHAVLDRPHSRWILTAIMMIIGFAFGLLVGLILALL